MRNLRNEVRRIVQEELGRTDGMTHKLIKEGRGNAVMRFEGINWPTYYIEYDPDEADFFYDDVITNTQYSIKKHGFDKLSRPRFINEWSVKFEGHVSDVCFTDNEWSIAVSVIPNEDYFYESNGDLSEYNREATKVFNEIQSMYTLHARTSAWSSAKVKGKIIVNE